MVHSTVSITSSDILAEEYAGMLADEIQKEIDESIMLDMLVWQGWTKVPLHYHNAKHAVDVIDWCIANLPENKWKRLSDSYVFCNKQDAEWFILRWL